MLRCTALKPLPHSLPGKKGWPWTGESTSVAGVMSNGQPWPRITIVTPSCNQGAFIEEAIRSVLLQGYPNLEYVVVDGGSSDQSVAVIQKYEKYLSWWVSERDKGQSDALKKGFNRATGEVLGWINSDDMLAPGALQAVAEAWASQHPALVSGTVEDFVDGRFGEKHVVWRQQKVNFQNLLRPWIPEITYHQPGIFFSSRLYEQVGGIDGRWHMKMDYDLFLRILAKDDRVTPVDQTIAYFRSHAGAKTAVFTPGQLREHCQVTAAYRDRLSREDRLRLKAYYAFTSLVLAVKRLLTGRQSYAKEHMEMLMEMLSPPIVVLTVVWSIRYLWHKCKEAVVEEGLHL